MKKLRKHWQMVAVALLVTVVGGTAWWRSSVQGAALLQDPSPYTVLDRVQHDKIVQLMKDIALDRDALIALNPSAEQAESILSTVRTWQADNATTLAGLKRTIGQKIVALRKIDKAIRVGPAEPGQDARLALARQELSEAKAAYTGALNPLKTSVEALLSQSQETSWSAIQSGWGQQMPLRLLALGDTQRMQLGKAHRRYERRRAAASTKTELDAAVTAWESELDQLLTQDQKNVLSAYNGYYATASGAAADAYETVLAVDEG